MWVSVLGGGGRPVERHGRLLRAGEGASRAQDFLPLLADRIHADWNTAASSSIADERRSTCEKKGRVGSASSVRMARSDLAASSLEGSSSTPAHDPFLPTARPNDTTRVHEPPPGVLLYITRSKHVHPINPISRDRHLSLGPKLDSSRHLAFDPSQARGLKSSSFLVDTQEGQIDALQEGYFQTLDHSVQRQDVHTQEVRGVPHDAFPRLRPTYRR